MSRESGVLQIPDEVLSIARTLEDAGFETWCVGGAVRDNLLGIPNHDFDLATAATPDDVQRLFKRTVPVGVEHGTVAVLDKDRKPHEVTTFRRDVTTDGRHATVAFGVSLDDDLARRDFTINAIAYHPITGEWRDPFRGRNDLDAKLLRAVGEPAQRFREDYLRILRLLRFAARFGFTIDPATWEAARAEAHGLKHLSAERVRDEWFKGLGAAREVGEFLHLWKDVGAVEMWLPGLEVGGSRLAVGGDRDPVVITSLLSADPAATLRRLKCSGAEIERARRIGEWRGERPDATSDADVRRWLAMVGESADDLLAVWKDTRLAETVARVRASGAPLAVSDLAIDGKDILSLGIPPSPAVGEILRTLLDEVLDDPSKNTREYLLARASALTDGRA